MINPINIQHDPEPPVVFEYTDEAEGFQGWLVIDSLKYRLSAGGMRVQEGLTREHLIDMARNMSRKMHVAGLRINGAKCGIDYAPDSPNKENAVTRFMQAISPFIMTSYSMGPDLNIDMDDLEQIAAALGIPSVKMAVAKAQGWNLDYFKDRYDILHKQIDGIALGRLRAGYGVSAAVIGILDFMTVDLLQTTVAVQGFGTLAKAALWGLHEAHIPVTAVADKEKCIYCPDGLNIPDLLVFKTTELPPDGYSENVQLHPPDFIESINCDIIVPAAVENTITAQNASQLRVKAVVPGANLAVSHAAQEILHKQGIYVVPDFIAGCGGSLSMEGLFGPRDHPTPRQVLEHVKRRMNDLVTKTLRISSDKTVLPLDAAHILISRNRNSDSDETGLKPYSI